MKGAFYLQVGTEKLGPLTYAEVRERWTSDPRVTPATLYRPEGKEEWAPLSELFQKAAAEPMEVPSGVAARVIGQVILMLVVVHTLGALRSLWPGPTYFASGATVACLFFVISQLQQLRAERILIERRKRDGLPF